MYCEVYFKSSDRDKRYALACSCHNLPKIQIITWRNVVNAVSRDLNKFRHTDMSFTPIVVLKSDFILFLSRIFEPNI